MENARIPKRNPLSPRDFLNVLKRWEIDPNFWCSEEYLEKSESKIKEHQDWIEICNESDLPLFPMINQVTGETLLGPAFCGFPNRPIMGTFLDNQYIYDPKNFRNLRNVSKKFKKNAFKWPQSHISHSYRILQDSDENFIISLLLEWSNGKIIQDPEVMTKFLLYGSNRMGLFEEGKLVGINCWDENWKYINYRYCICKSDRFLSEYLRLLFYIDVSFFPENKLVNDGGDLGSASLAFFKRTLNPIKIEKIYGI